LIELIRDCPRIETVTRRIHFGSKYSRGGKGNDYELFDNQDSRYDYLMLLTNDWIASQNHCNDFIRSIN